MEGFNFWLLKYEFYSYTNGRCFGEISVTLRKKSHIRDRRVKSFRLVGYKSRFSFLLHIEGFYLLVVELAGKSTQAVNILIVQSSEFLKNIKFMSYKYKKIPQYIDERIFSFLFVETV